MAFIVRAVAAPVSPAGAARVSANDNAAGCSAESAMEWEKLMEAAGWRPIRDVFDVVIAWEHANGVRIEAANVSMWRQLRQTPPPF
jgi:hypothetical protein